MSGKNIFRIIMYLFWFGIPIFLLLNCSNWSAAYLKASGCIVQDPVLRDIAGMLWTVIYMSAFVMFLPVIVYIAVIVGFTELIARASIFFEDEVQTNRPLNNAERLFEENILASRWKRLFAYLIDMLAVIIIVLPYMYFTGEFENKIEPTFLDSLIKVLIGLFIYFIINIKLLLTKGQTIGKKMLDIKIVNLDNSLVSKKNLLKRYLIFFAVPYIPIIGEWFALIDILFIFRSDKRCIHDLIGQTKVIKSF
jgi:uncharacterized RDD family membrane protein YckC